jgi:hypothetical protein
MNLMIHITHRFHNDLGTIENTLSTISPCISAEEGTMRILEIEVLDGFPDFVDFIGW